jgi:hypothetical protein
VFWGLVNLAVGLLLFQRELTSLKYEKKRFFSGHFLCVCNCFGRGKKCSQENLEFIAKAYGRWWFELAKMNADELDNLVASAKTKPTDAGATVMTIAVNKKRGMDVFFAGIKDTSAKLSSIQRSNPECRF